MSVNKKSRIRLYLLMLLAAAAVFMDYLDTSIVSIVLPEISNDFSASPSASSWVLVSYLLALGCSLLIFGKIADKTGRCKLIFTAGFALFTISSFFCAAAPALIILIIFRFIQGLAAALMVSTATSIINLHLPEKIQGPATGLIAAGGGIALAAGPGLGGLIAEFLSWNWVFLINIPIGIIGVAGALLLIPADKKTETKSKREEFDGIGAVLLAAALFSLITGLEFGSQEGWPLYSIILLIACPVIGFFFVHRETRCKDPVLSTKLFLNKTVALASVSTMLVTLAFAGILFTLPFYFTGTGLSIGLTGLVMLIPPACLALIGIPSGTWSVKFGCKKLCSIGTFLFSAGFVILTAGIYLSNFIMILAGLILIGLGNGLNEGPSIRRINIHSPSDLQGSSGGLVFTAMNAGYVFGVALFSLIASAASEGPEFTSFGVAASCLAGAGFAVLSYITSKCAADTKKA
ncbi:MAG: MFS transporter [Methanocorpusculum sp.]|nr:MFS transporter [Methanocorpusculum sp.]